MDRFMRILVVSVLVGCLWPGGWTLASDFAAESRVRIVVADEDVGSEGVVRQIMVVPGQVVSLSAYEVFVEADGRVEYARRASGDFAWQAVGVDEHGRWLDSFADRCSPAEECPPGSRFEATPFGVNYYVPWEPPPRIRIRASLKGGPASDFVDLVNEEWARNTERPAWMRALDGMGYWVRVADQRLFVPVGYVAGWTPYRHGYWYWTAFGWTWYSFDPWGAITDHCGHWRHHRRYGWVWVPDPVCVWRPAVVTFFYGPVWIGWYPYDPGWTGYWYGYGHGFDDGYWLGYAVGQASQEGRANPGFVATTYEDFCPDKPPQDRPNHDGSGGAPRRHTPTASRPIRDLSKVRLADPVAANEAFNEAFRKGHVGPVPGGERDPANGWKFWTRKTGFRPVEVPLRRTSLGSGSGPWFEPVNPPAHIPDEYREAATRVRSATGALGGGEVIKVGVGKPLDGGGPRKNKQEKDLGRPAPDDRLTLPSRAFERVRAEERLPARTTQARRRDAASPALSSPGEAVRVPPRQGVPTAGRVVPARPSVQPPSRPADFRTPMKTTVSTSSQRLAPQPAIPSSRRHETSTPASAPKPESDRVHSPRTAPDSRSETRLPKRPYDVSYAIDPDLDRQKRPVRIPSSLSQKVPVHKFAPAIRTVNPVRR